jgi:hypothetical protein
MDTNENGCESKLGLTTRQSIPALQKLLDWLRCWRINPFAKSQVKKQYFCSPVLTPGNPTILCG